MALRPTGLPLARLLPLFGVSLVVALSTLLEAQDGPTEPSMPTLTSTQPTTAAAPVDQSPAASQPSEAGPEEPGGPKVRSVTEDPEPRREPDAAEILKALTKQGNRAGNVVIRPTQPGRTEQTTVSPEGTPQNLIGTAEKKLLPDGYRLVDRPGRLVREADYWVFSFENRGTGDQQLPIRLLPNRLLEDMESFSEGGAKPIVFIVSGEITEYHNVNYLLVQKLLTRADLGNLK